LVRGEVLVGTIARAAGHPVWRGEVNAVRGRRRSALERVVGPVVDEVPNRTYSWLAGRPVDRLTVERAVDRGVPTPREAVSDGLR
jgi:hypothetical protein